MKKAHQPTLFIDDQCAFCRHWADKVHQHTDGRITIRPLSEAKEDYPDAQHLPNDTAILYDDGQMLTRGQLIRKYFEWRYGSQHLLTRLIAHIPLVLLNGIYRFIAWGRPLWSVFYRRGG